MPIRPFLNGQQFDQETVRILGVAFEQVCIVLRIGHCGDDVKNAIANKIIELAKTGERNPDLLCERALEDIRQPQVGQARHFFWLKNSSIRVGNWTLTALLSVRVGLL
jgi:hypothetical protein